MLKHQKIDWICAAVMALAAAAAVLFMNGEKLGLIPASSSPGYESRLFDKSKVHQVEILREEDPRSGSYPPPSGLTGKVLPMWDCGPREIIPAG